MEKNKFSTKSIPASSEVFLETIPETDFAFNSGIKSGIGIGSGITIDSEIEVDLGISRRSNRVCGAMILRLY